MKTFTHKDRSEVDVRVAQEIKNHNDAMYNTGQSINSLKEKLDALYVEKDKVINKSDSDTKKVLIAFENFEKDTAAKLKEMHKRIENVESSAIIACQKVNDLRQKVLSEYATSHYQQQTLKDVNNNICKLEESFLTEKEYIEQRFRQLRSQFVTSLEALRMDLTQVIPEIDPVQKKIDERFAIFKVDFDGLVQEIDKLKKADSYDQKKFENIYTLIQRLKERKE